MYNLAANGYYDENYMFRVIPGKYVQFGTAGDPTVSNVFNYTTTTNKCAILQPQPPAMPYCMAEGGHGQSCEGVSGLSNTFGTLSMSTAYKINSAYPEGVTWNATAELFISIGHDNMHLDANLFVPICTITPAGMDNVLEFPSFGEVKELGGPLGLSPHALIQNELICSLQINTLLWGPRWNRRQSRPAVPGRQRIYRAESQLVAWST